jgi:hypothetical protein
LVFNVLLNRSTILAFVKVIKKDDVYKIEMILKKIKKGRQVQYLVRWLGYPDTFNSWIFKQDLQKKVTLPK